MPKNERKVIHRKIPVKKKKVVPIPVLRRKLRMIMSTWVRFRDCDSNGMLTCCSSGRQDHIYSKDTKWNAGHFFCKEGNPALEFEPNNINTQWSMSNMRMKRNITWDYFLFMEKKYGRAEIDRLASLRGVPFKLTRDWLEQQIQHYKKEVEKLKKEKNL